MTGIEIGLAIGVPIVGGVVSYAVAWGHVKGKMEVFIDHPTHREICHEKSVEFHGKIDKLREDMNVQLNDISRSLGRIEGILKQ